MPKMVKIGLRAWAGPTRRFSRDRSGLPFFCILVNADVINRDVQLSVTQRDAAYVMCFSVSSCVQCSSRSAPIAGTTWTVSSGSTVKSGRSTLRTIHRGTAGAASSSDL